MEFLAHLIGGIFMIIGFSATVFLAILYGLDIYVNHVQDKKTPTDTVNEEFNNIVHR